MSLKKCPHCNIDLAGEDIFEKLFGKSNYHTEIIKDPNGNEVSTKLSDYSAAAKAAYAASLYGWSVKKPKTFMNYISYQDSITNRKWTKCPSCGGTW